jgi:hypothetical protein
VEIANRAKRFSRRFHCVPAERAVHVKIDKTGRKIISIEINDLVFLLRQGSLANRGDFSLLHDNFKPVANSIGKNQTRVCEDHLVMQSILPARRWRLNRNSRCGPGNSSQTDCLHHSTLLLWSGIEAILFEG